MSKNISFCVNANVDENTLIDIKTNSAQRSVKPGQTKRYQNQYIPQT